MTDPTGTESKLAVGLMKDGDVFVEYGLNGETFTMSPEQALTFAGALSEAAKLSPKCPRKQ